VALLERHGWERPDDNGFPTGRELAERYLDPLAATPEIAPRLRLGSRVTGVARLGAGKVRTAGRELMPFEVRTLDRVYEWEQTRSQGLVIDVDHPVLGRIELPGPPLRFDDNAHAGGRTEHLPPPALGEHDASVRAWLDALDATTGADPA